MSRYYPDARRQLVAAAMDAEVQRAREAEAGGGWITYLIRDPSRPDLRGNAAGTPIYVGQTKEFAKRVRNRFDKCEKEAKPGIDSIERRVSDLLHKDIVVSYEVLDRQPTRLSSLLSETNWARLYVAKGYDIANRLALQRENGMAISRHDIPIDWLWCFSLQEGIEDGFRAEVGCANCRATLTVDLDFFLTIQRPPKTLRDIRIDSMWRQEPCVCCNQTKARYATIRVPA